MITYPRQILLLILAAACAHQPAPDDLPRPEVNPDTPRKHAAAQPEDVPTPEAISAAEIGSPPDPTLCATALAAVVRRRVMDPVSALFEFAAAPVRDAYISESLDDRGIPQTSLRPAWRFDADVNAKNTYGAYTGRQQYSLWVISDIAVGWTEPRFFRHHGHPMAMEMRLPLADAERLAAEAVRDAERQRDELGERVQRQSRKK